MVTWFVYRGPARVTFDSPGPIAVEMQEHIFKRFFRGSMGENVPGHGLGLNLARELTRLHGGEAVLAILFARQDDQAFVNDGR